MLTGRVKLTAEIIAKVENITYAKKMQLQSRKCHQGIKCYTSK